MAPKPQSTSIYSKESRVGFINLNNSVLEVDLKDKQLWGYMQEVPKVSAVVAFVAFAMNILIPGLGTIIAACAVDDMVPKTHVLIGVLQFLT